jgi:hypothetical protein
MKINKFLLVTVVVLSLILSACESAKPVDSTIMDKPTEAMMEKPTDTMQGQPTEDMIMEATSTPDMMMDNTTPEAMMDIPTEAAMMDAPMWFSASFMNASDGKAFAINDFKGKVVLLETMAVWCSNCKSQQEQIKDLHTAMGMPADLVTITLDIDPNENNDVLKDYVVNNGFDWIYATASGDVSREIGKLYGDQFLNPTSTPMLIIDRKGEVHKLPFGIKSTEDLKKAVEPYLNEM